MRSLEELRKIRDEVKKEMDLRNEDHRARVVVCMGTCGIAAGARETMKAIMDGLAEKNVSDVAVTAAGCAGFCDQEPLVEVEVQGEAPVRYGKVDAEGARRIVGEHLVEGRRVSDLLFD